MKNQCDICKVSLGKSYVRFVYTVGQSAGTYQAQEGMYIGTFERVVGNLEREKVACPKCVDKYDGISRRWTVLLITSAAIAALSLLFGYTFADLAKGTIFEVFPVPIFLVAVVGFIVGILNTRNDALLNKLREKAGSAARVSDVKRQNIEDGVVVGETDIFWEET